MKKVSSDVTLEGISKLMDEKLLNLSGELKQDIQGIKQDVRTVKKDVNNLKNDFAGIKPVVQSIKHELDNLREEMKEGFTKVDKDLIDLRSTIKDYSDDIQEHVERRLDKLEKHVFAT